MQDYTKQYKPIKYNTWFTPLYKSKQNDRRTYRVFCKTVATFVFWIYRLPRGLEIHSWTFSWAIMSTRQWCQARLWALKSVHGTMAPYCWVLLRAHKWLWLFISAQALNPTINIKCWHWKWLFCSILAISRSTSYQMITNWTFLKSTCEGLLKNVQGSRGIKKTKARTVLVDTL